MRGSLLPFIADEDVLPERVDAAAYRALMSAFPTGVAIVTSVDATGAPRGLTCSSLSSVAVSPPTLLVCLHNDSGTLDALLSRGAFAVNLLDTSGQAAAEVFAEPRSDRFNRLPWQATEMLGLPILPDAAFAVAECAVSHTVVVGDHRVVFGEVLTISQRDATPLLYGLRRYFRWPIGEALHQ